MPVSRSVPDVAEKRKNWYALYLGSVQVTLYFWMKVAAIQI